MISLPPHRHHDYPSSDDGGTVGSNAFVLLSLLKPTVVRSKSCYCILLQLTNAVVLSQQCQPPPLKTSA